jgi:ABC-type Fe3+-hydroxamate transport system substrate-binding protein
MNQRFEQTNERFDQANGRFDGLEETVHLNGVVVESLRDELRLVAEGFMGYSDQMEKHSAEVDRKLDDLKALIGPTYRSLEQKTDS